MKKYLPLIALLFASFFFISACTSTPTVNKVTESNKDNEILIVYEDGRMEFDSRYLDRKDVVIYADGRGGERAAIKVRFPLHSDFYRDSIIVVRVVKKIDESIGQQASGDVKNIN